MKITRQNLSSLFFGMKVTFRGAPFAAHSTGISGFVELKKKPAAKKLESLLRSKPKKSPLFLV